MCFTVKCLRSDFFHKMAHSYQTSTLSLTLPISCQICLGKVSLFFYSLLLMTSAVKQRLFTLHAAAVTSSGTSTVGTVLQTSAIVLLLYVKALGFRCASVVQVKQPVICANYHVFCSSCMQMWLKKASQCPSCRVSITPENPCREIIGK